MLIETKLRKDQTDCFRNSVNFSDTDVTLGENALILTKFDSYQKVKKGFICKDSFF